MAIEPLNVPEEHLADVIKVIRAGLGQNLPVHRDVKLQLARWCKEEEAYLKRLQRGE